MMPALPERVSAYLLTWLVTGNDLQSRTRDSLHFLIIHLKKDTLERIFLQLQPKSEVSLGMLYLLLFSKSSLDFI